MKELTIEVNPNFHVGNIPKPISIQTEDGNDFDLTAVKSCPWIKDNGWYIVTIIDRDKKITRVSSHQFNNIDHIVRVIDLLNEEVDNKQKLFTK